MRKLMKKLDDNGVIDDGTGPCGAPVVLSAKPHQEGVNWKDFIWRMGTSFRRMNQVTKPFAFLTPRCDDTVEEIDTKEKFFITIDLDSGYWQVVVDPESD